MKRGLAIFDLDGTLTRKDTLIEFIRYCHGSLRLYLGFLLHLPYLLLYLLKLYDNEKFKQRMLKHFFAKLYMEEIQAKGNQFAEKVLPGLLYHQAKEKLQWHRQQRHKIVILSASCSVWIKTWADAAGYDLVCTEMAFKNERFNGSFNGPNCHGAEKVKRLKAQINLGDFDEIFAYGNHFSDLPYMELAHHKFYKPFKK